MEGQLKKKGSKRGPFGDSWKGWYFVLEGATMRYYAGGSTEGNTNTGVTEARNQHVHWLSRQRSRLLSACAS
jgi:hypothetical protein